MSISNHSGGRRSRLPLKKKPAFQSVAPAAFAVLAGLMLLLAVPNLIPDPGILGIVKSVVIACAGILVSYAVIHFALEKGTELAATGFWTAGIVSIASMGVVGFGLFSSTYAGLTIQPVRQLQLQAYGREFANYVGQRSKAAAEAGRAGPALRANEAQLREKVTCEIRESCVSGRSRSGRGPITRVLEEKASRAGAIAGQLEAGERLRKATLADINGLMSDYQKVLLETDKSLVERRRKLIRIAGKMDQSLAELDEAMPVSLLRAYADELEGGVSIAGRPAASRRISALLGKQASSLKAVLDTVQPGRDTKPKFPAWAGVSSTFSYMAHFLPIAALTLSIELIFPISLWVYVLLGLVWERHPANRSQDQGQWRERPARNAPHDDHVAPFPNATKSRRKSLKNGADRSE